ncbi:MAG: T9SS type A sorting domain-containing protein [Tannerella sp.]|nr:T9SS type A sorting domain-containing protein [Tannerella sp.]
MRNNITMLVMSAVLFTATLGVAKAETDAVAEDAKNLALLPSVEVSTSLCSSWETLDYINDDKAPENSGYLGGSKQYGNWPSPGAYNWVEYAWPLAHNLTGSSVYWCSDGGGLLAPDDAYLEYWDGTGWVKIGSIGGELDKFNELSFDVQSRKIRIYMKSNTESTGVHEWKVFGIETASCDVSEVKPYVITNGSSREQQNYASLNAGSSVTFSPALTDSEQSGTWTWKGPDSFTSTGREVSLSNLKKEQSGTYTVIFINDCGTETTLYFHLTVNTGVSGASYAWPAYSPTLNYHFTQEYPDIKEPTKDLIDDTKIAGTISDGWWTFHWGPDANTKVTSAAVTPMLKRMNEDFEYIRNTMGWPLDKRAKNGYRSAIYLYGSGLNTDNANNTTDLGGWQGSIHYQGEDWPMVLLSWYPVYAFDPNCGFTESDRTYQMGAVVHEGIHSILADMPGCKQAAWFHEGGNTWLQQEMDSERSGDYSEMGFLNGAPFIAPFMPIECYSGWLQDETFGGPSAEGVNKFEGSQQVCTWKNYLGGTQYGNMFPVYMGQTLGNGSIPWVWRYCEGRVLEGMAGTLGSEQTRRLIMEYRAKQALLDFGKWTDAIKKLVNNNFGTNIGPEWEPYWINSPTWKATPYAATTLDKATRILTPEYRTTPGWSGGNQIPLHVEGDKVSVTFEPLGENMSCQLCYRTKNGETVYGQPSFGGECVLKLDKKPANGVVFAVVSNLNYIYEGEKTRTAHYDYRLKLGEGATSAADINKKWYDWTLDLSVSNEIIEKEADKDVVTIYQSGTGTGSPVHIQFENQLSEPTLLNVLNLSGISVYNTSINDISYTIPSGNLSSGVYIFTFTSQKNNITKKVLVK